MTHLAYLGQGGNYHVKKWLRALAEQSLEVTLISFTEPDEEIPGVTFRKLEPPFGGGKRLRLWHFWGSTEPLRLLLEEIGAHVLMASYATNYGFLGARTGFSPLIAQTWTIDLTVYPVSGWKQWVLGPMARRALRDADVITTDGEALAEQGRILYPGLADRFAPIRWGIRTADFEITDSLRREARTWLEIPVGVPVVTSARGVLPYYRPRVILEGLLHFLEEDPRAYAVFLTLGRERGAEIDRLLDRLGSHERARVIDTFVPAGDMKRIWALTDVVISIPEFDGVSEGLLEGMYCGCIPLVSDIPSNRSILEHEKTGIFLTGDVASALDLSNSLRNVVGRLDQLKSEIPDRNRKWILKHASVETSAERLAGIVRELASDR